ncbi:MAG: caspase family protein, partial [bacterium]
MRRFLFFIAIVFIAAALASPAHAQWWKKEREKSRLDEQVVHSGGRSAVRLKWDDGYIEVKALGTADPALVFSVVQGKAMAVEAARALAYAKLAEAVEGVSVDGVTLVKNALLQSQVVRTRVKAHIKNARVLSEKAMGDMDRGFSAEVTLGMLLRGPGGLAGNVTPWAATRPVKPYKPDAAFRTHEKFTGVIVETSDTGFRPSLAPRILEEKTEKVIFGPHLVAKEILQKLGPVGYAARLDKGKAKKRVGKNPLIVQAIAASGKKKGDIVLVKKDADRLLAADREGKFLSQAAVMIVLSRPTKEIMRKPGKNYGVFVGIAKYPKTAGAEFGQLDFAAKDAQAMAALLSTRTGYDSSRIKVLVDRAATRQAIIDALRDLRGRVKEEDMVLLYFSAHGTTGKGEDGRSHYYMVPYDGRVEDIETSGVQD